MRGSNKPVVLIDHKMAMSLAKSYIHETIYVFPLCICSSFDGLYHTKGGRKEKLFPSWPA